MEAVPPLRKKVDLLPGKTTGKRDMEMQGYSLAEISIRNLVKLWRT
jgi:hypothetical protein